MSKHIKKWEQKRKRPHNRPDRDGGRPIMENPNVPLTPAQSLPDSMTVGDLRVEGDLDLSYFDSLEPDQGFMVNPTGATQDQVYTVQVDDQTGAIQVQATDAATIAVTTDSVAPTAGATLVVEGGPGWFAVHVTPDVDNPDPTWVNLYCGTADPGLNPAPSDFVGKVSGALVFVKKDASGNSFAYNTTYYFRATQEDADGESDAGAVSSATLSPVTSLDTTLADTNNLAEDASFEAWDAAGDSYQGAGFGNTWIRSGAAWSRDDTVVRTGSYSALHDGAVAIAQSDSPDTILESVTRIPWAIGDQFYAEVYHIKDGTASTALAGVTIHIMTNDGASLHEETATLVTPTDGVWNQSTVEYTVDAGDVGGSTQGIAVVRVRVNGGNADNAKLYFDDVRFVKRGDTKTLGTNSIIAEHILAESITAEKLESVVALVSALLAGDPNATHVDVGYGTDASGNIDPSFIGIRAFNSDGVRTFVSDAQSGELSVYGNIGFGADPNNPSRLTNTDLMELAGQIDTASYLVPDVVQTINVLAESGTASATLSGATTDGNVTFAILFIEDDDGTNPTPTTPSGWTLDSSTANIAGSPDTGTNKEGSLYVYRRNATTAFSSTVSVTLNDTCAWSFCLMEVSGITNAAPVETTTDTGANDNPTLTSTGVLGAANNFVLVPAVFFADTGDDAADAFLYAASDFNQDTPSGFTQVGGCYNGLVTLGTPWRAQGKLCTHYKATTATTAIAASLNLTNTDELYAYIAKQLVYRAAAAPSQPSTPATDRLKIYNDTQQGESRAYAVNDVGLVSDLMLPAGCVLPFAGSTAPVGFLLCYGQSLLRADYPALFTAIGTTYGSADGTHFTLPDMRGRIPVTLDNMGGSDAGNLTMANTLGGTGGEEKHTLVNGELPSHTHDITDGVGGTNYRASGTGGLGAGSTTFARQGGTTTQLKADTVGTDTPHNNLQPYILMNYIIKF